MRPPIVDRRRRAALVGHVDGIDAGHEVEELAAEVIGVADAGGSEGELSRLPLRFFNQLPDVLRLEVVGDDEDVRRRRDRGKRHEVGFGAERQVRQRRGADREAVLGEEQRVAVARRLRHRVGGEIAGRAGARLDVDALLPVGAQAIGHHPADDVGRAARGIADDDADRLRRELGICME